MLYFLMITFAMLCVWAGTITASLVTGYYSLLHAILCPFFVNAYVLVVLGLTTLFMRILIPRNAWNGDRGIFAVAKKEIQFYNKINIKAWKDKVPEMGSTGGFAKRHINSLEEKYLWKFLQETCFAEAMHYVVSALGFTVLFFLNIKDLWFALPILFINAILNILPSLIQRYNRYRLLILYKKISQKE